MDPKTPRTPSPRAEYSGSPRQMRGHRGSNRPRAAPKPSETPEDPFVEAGGPSTTSWATEEDKRRNLKAKVYQSILLEHHRLGEVDLPPFPSHLRLGQTSNDFSPPMARGTARQVSMPWDLKMKGSADKSLPGSSLTREDRTVDPPPCYPSVVANHPPDNFGNYPEGMTAPGRPEARRSRSSAYLPDTNTVRPAAEASRAPREEGVRLTEEQVKFIKSLEDGSFLFRRKPS